MFELGAYLRRIGCSGRPSLAEVHRAHATSILFEGLSAHAGEPVSLDPDALAAKMVEGDRGGYCFEHNVLLMSALRALGYRVEPHLARVRLGLQPGAPPRGRTHLLLRVDDGERSWHADVGFGAGTPIEPIPWGPGEENEQAGWGFRVGEHEGEGEWVLQARDAGGWSDLYSFTPEPVPPVDIETSNWWASTNPESRFVSGLLVSRQWPDGRRLILSDWGELSIVERAPSGDSARPVARHELPGLLAERFGLHGFHLDEQGRLAPERPARR